MRDEIEKLTKKTLVEYKKLSKTDQRAVLKALLADDLTFHLVEIYGSNHE